MSDDGRRPRYPSVAPKPDFAELEREILALWSREGTFRRSVTARPRGPQSRNEYVFYDGPPFANGLPHYGHLLTGYVKDIVPRYQTMRGRRVERRFGWDCHGLPAEMEAERELEVSGRAAIEAYGIGRFNAHCRRAVMRYTEQWEDYVHRQARWVDFENDYKTMDLHYMESVIWAFRRLFERGLLYEGERVLPYSWAAETPISHFETRLDDSYRERKDPAITVRFATTAGGADEPTEFWAWTTTPWTIPSNLALVVGPDMDYAIVSLGERRIAIACSALERYAEALRGGKRIAVRKGRQLVGTPYRPPFPFFGDTPGAFRVLAGDFVSTEEGTGIVHTAPGFGEDDLRVATAAGIPVLCPVDSRGRFSDAIPPWRGQLVFDANPAITRALAERGALVREESIVHNYPHCWRTGTPLIYRAVNSWYVRVSSFAARMVELNREIRWIPEHVRDGRFGKWLEGARDWSISRHRFWGSPIPVWKSDDPRFPRLDVYGSLDELERDFGVRPSDLHRPAIDELERPNPDDPSGRSRMRRVPDVLDCWFESGSMPFAQVHYPFENREFFEAHFPADFIVEYIAQTRGWFYTLMVLGTALFDRPPFQNCIAHGVVLDQRGQKLAKRLRNYPDPLHLFARYGSDALRWFLVASPILRGHDLRIDREGKAVGAVARSCLLPFWSAYAFFCLYAEIDGVEASRRADAPGLLDRYLLAKTRTLVETVTTHMDAYDLAGACREIEAYLDALTNWYIRRSRERFWRGGLDRDKRCGYDTLYTALCTLAEVAAPLLPFLAETVHRGLAGGGSVHLCDWPDAASLPADPELVAAMDRVREVCSAARTVREREGLRVRQPLASLTVAGAGASSLAPYGELIQSEVNVKRIHLEDSVATWADSRLQVNARVAGPRLGAAVQGVLAAARRGVWRQLEGGRIRIANCVLEAGEYQLRLDPKPGVSGEALASQDAIVVLDLELDEELIDEGIARDLVRGIQQARKEAGLHVADRIRLVLPRLPPSSRKAAERFRSWIAAQTLAASIDLSGDIGAELSHHRLRLGDLELEVGLARAIDPHS